MMPYRSGEQLEQPLRHGRHGAGQGDDDDQPAGNLNRDPPGQELTDQEAHAEPDKGSHPHDGGEIWPAERDDRARAQPDEVDLDGGDELAASQLVDSL